MIYLSIEQNRTLWENIFTRLHTRGYVWYRTKFSLNNFYFLNFVLQNGARGIMIDLENKEVAWTSNPYKSNYYCIEIKN